MGAKVRNFYIFDGDEIDFEESPQLLVCGQRCFLLLFIIPAAVLFFA
jgi:hypothetical protein